MGCNAKFSTMDESGGEHAAIEGIDINESDCRSQSSVCRRERTNKTWISCSLEVVTVSFPGVKVVLLGFFVLVPGLCGGRILAGSLCLVSLTCM